MQALADSSMDNPSTSTGMRIRPCEDVKGAQFVIQSNLKILARSIAALSKMAEDLFIEISEMGMFLKVFNRSQSAYCMIRFAPDFFNNCDLSLINTKQANICRISAKTAYTVFKGLTSGEKNFVDCEFRIDPNADKMAVKLNLTYDITREIQVNLLEMSRCLPKPVHDKSKFRNSTIVFASVLLPILNQMKNELEVTLVAEEEFLQIRNYPSSEMSNLLNITEIKKCRKVRTETKIAADKLSRHEITFPIEVSFSLREFLAVVVFADQLGSEVCIYYETPGMPIIVSIEAHPNFDIELRLATPTDDENFEIDGGILEDRTTEIEENESSSTPVERADSSIKQRSQKTRGEKNSQSLEKESDRSPEKSTYGTRIPSRNTNTDRTISEENEEVRNGTIEDLNATWRRNEIFENQETQALPRELEYEEEIEDIHPVLLCEDTQPLPKEPVFGEDFDEIQPICDPVEMCEEEMMGEHISERESTNLGLRLETTLTDCQEPERGFEEKMDVGLTPPPANEDSETKIIPPRKKRKTDEMKEEPTKIETKSDKRNRKLRRILMGTRKGEFGEEVTQRMSQLFAGKEMLATDTQRL